jgi:hypothetical protein
MAHTYFDKLLNLYVVYLGGPVLPGRMGEDHEVIAVVAADIPAARKAAKAKWKGFGDPHVDAVQHLDVVDGHKVNLVIASADQRDATHIDLTWVP